MFCPFTILLHPFLQIPSGIDDNDVKPLKTGVTASTL